MSSLEQIVQQLLDDRHPKLPEGHPIADGKPHRYGAGKKYWYSLHQIERAGQIIGYTGAFGRWSGNDNGAQAFQWEGEALAAEDVNAARQRQQAAERIEAEKRAHAAR